MNTNKQKELRVLHCPQLVGGQATNIARHERKLGVKSTAIAFESSIFGYPADEILWKEDATLYAQEIERWQLFYRALKYFDVVHYNFGYPILNWGAIDGRHRKMAFGLGGLYASFNHALELPALKRAGKVIAVTYQGDDARQGDFSRENFEICIANEVDETYYTGKTDDEKCRRISRFAEYADLIYALNPDLLRVLPEHAVFLPYAHIDIQDWLPCVNVGNARPLVVHAPSHRGAKGTRFIIEAVRRLKEKGLDFDFTMVEGLKQHEARKLYQRADIVVDQLLAGWYGGFAVEAMALGKPVICYLRHSDLQYIPANMREELPIIEATPDTIENTLRDWINRSEYDRIAKGIQSRRFVEVWHDPHLIAQRLVSDYSRSMANQVEVKLANG